MYKSNNIKNLIYSTKVRTWNQQATELAPKLLYRNFNNQ